MEATGYHVQALTHLRTDYEHLPPYEESQVNFSGQIRTDTKGFRLKKQNLTNIKHGIVKLSVWCPLINRKPGVMGVTQIPRFTISYPPNSNVCLNVAAQVTTSKWSIQMVSLGRGFCRSRWNSLEFKMYKANNGTGYFGHQVDLCICIHAYDVISIRRIRTVRWKEFNSIAYWIRKSILYELFGGKILGPAYRATMPCSTRGG